MKIRFILLFLVIYFISCSNNSYERFKGVDVGDVITETDISQVNTLDVKKINCIYDTLISKTSDVFDSVEYIPLSNEPDAVIGKIEKIIFSDSSFFVHDKWKTKSVKRFGLDGSYIATIGNRGQGPEEYLDATDFTIQDSMVLLYDSYQDKIIYYDLNGKFIKSKKTKFVFNSFCAKYFDIICYEVQCPNPHIKSIENYNLIISDTSYNIKHKAIYNHLRPVQSQPFSSSVTSSDKIYYSRHYSDTIYSVNPQGKIYAEYIYKFDKPILPFSIQQTKDSKLFNREVAGSKYVTIGTFNVTEDFVFVECTKDMKNYYNFYSKNTNLVKVYSHTVEYDNAPLGMSTFVASYGNTMISYVIPGSFGFSQRREYVNKYYPKFQKFISTIKDEDNPIIVLAHIKDF